jgi:hypothetical protein
MLEFLGSRASDRKLRLFICACVRRIWPLLSDARSRQAVEIAERFADGDASADQLDAAAQAAWEAAEAAEVNASPPVELAAWAAAQAPAPWASPAVARHAAAEAGLAESAVRAPRGPLTERSRGHCSIMRDLFGNPFRIVLIDPVWLETNARRVVQVAQAIYRQGRFDALPQLAAALETAGCTDEDILTHCRIGKHVRGCWLLDELLGLERPAEVLEVEDDAGIQIQP